MVHTRFCGVLRASVCAVALYSCHHASAQTALPIIDVVAPRDPGAGEPDVANTTAGPVRGYQALTARGATRTDTPVEQLPQSVVVLPRKVIDDQVALTQSEALRNISGVSPLNELTYGQLSPRVRGFSADRIVDGLPNFYDAGARDLLVNVERIEALKGPQSVLYVGGGSTLAGAINVVSKLPTLTRFAEFGLTAGGYRYWSPYFDINQPLNKEGTILFRMTGQFEHTRAFTDVIERRAFTLNPTVAFTNHSGTALTLQGHFSQRDQQDYSGLPIWGTLNRSAATIRRDLFPSDPNIPKTRSDIVSLTARLEHVFSPVWSTYTIVRIARSNFHEPSQGLVSNSPSAPPATFDVYNLSIHERTREISANSALLAKFDWAFTRNKLLFSLDYNRTTERGAMFGDFIGAPVNFLNPVFPPYLAQAGVYSAPDNTYTTTGASVQLQTTLFERLHLLASGRIAHLRISDYDGTGMRALLTGSSLAVTDKTKFLPRVGAAFEIVKGVSLFAGYSEGIMPTIFFFGLSPALPQQSKQLEGGVKLNLGHGLSATFAAFDLRRYNMPVSVGFYSVQSGEQRSRGLEADMVWQPTASWSILASYARVDAQVVKDTNLSLLGAPLVQAPRDSGRLWANYSFVDGGLKGLSIGAGLYASSRQVVELGNPWRSPGFVTFDAKISYKYDNWTFSVVGKNLADRRYFVPYSYLSGRVAPADGRSVFASVSSRF